jgi:hypothetical protein
MDGPIADYAPYRDFYTVFENDDHYAIHDDEADASPLPGGFWRSLTLAFFVLCDDDRSRDTVGGLPVPTG